MKMSRSEEEKASSKFWSSGSIWSRKKGPFFFSARFFSWEEKGKAVAFKDFFEGHPGEYAARMEILSISRTGSSGNRTRTRFLQWSRILWGWVVQKTTRVLNMREERTLEDTKFKPLFMQRPFTLRWSSPCYMHVWHNLSKKADNMVTYTSEAFFICNL